MLLPEPVISITSWVQKGVILMGAQRGFVINGESVRDHSGHSVSSAGDVNGDGLDDLIVGAYFTNSSAGKSYVVFKHNIRFTRR
jgi:hypothetical protein